MSMTERSIVRGAASVAAALVLLMGAVACTGGDEDEPTAAGPTTEAPDPQEPPAAGTEAASDAPAAESPFDQAELEVASQRFVDVLQVLDDRDWEAACGMVLDPTTGTAPEGPRLQECADGVEPVFAEHAGTLPPGAFDVVDVSMIEASDNGDDTVSLSVLGEDLGIPMAPGDDGRWYLVIPF